MRTRWKWLIGLAVAVVLIAVALAFFVDEPMRRVTERQMNARLKGYTARIGRLDFHPLGFGIDFHDVVLIQNAHPAELQIGVAMNEKRTLEAHAWVTSGSDILIGGVDDISHFVRLSPMNREDMVDYVGTS